eukprot:5598593-Prymnesium_polylepis.1
MPPCHCGVHSHNSKPFSRNRVPREVTSRFVGFLPCVPIRITHATSLIWVRTRASRAVCGEAFDKSLITHREHK